MWLFFVDTEQTYWYIDFLSCVFQNKNSKQTVACELIIHEYTREQFFFICFVRFGRLLSTLSIRIWLLNACLFAPKSIE